MTSDGLSAAVKFSSPWLHGFHNKCSDHAECDNVPFAEDVGTTSTSTATRDLWIEDTKLLEMITKPETRMPNKRMEKERL